MLPMLARPHRGLVGRFVEFHLPTPTSFFPFIPPPHTTTSDKCGPGMNGHILRPPGDTAWKSSGQTMREGCSCGAWVHATTRQVLQWRTEHKCPDRTDDPPQIDDRGFATAELASNVPIGFHIQPTNAQDPYEADE